MKISHAHSISHPAGADPPRGLFIMDFDGTLLGSDRTVARVDLNALEKIGRQAVVRVIATGRSLYVFNTAVTEVLPVDFVIFSMGAGVLQYPVGKIVRSVSLDPNEVMQAYSVLKACGLDFMVHRRIPENHWFSYHRSTSHNPDFERRLSRYKRFAAPFTEASDGFGPASQLLAVVSHRDGKDMLEKVRGLLPDFSVIQSTSPLDGKSTWIEVFPAAVSKSLTAAWLAEKLDIAKSEIVSVGNDYNDLDLLEWAAESYVVDNAPADLKNRFARVASNDHGGVAEAAKRWLTERYKVKG